MDFSEVKKLRKSTESLITETLPRFIERTESDFAESLRTTLYSHDNVYPSGWYAPPPHGICVIAASSPNFSRLNFDSLRRQQYWPSAQTISEDSVVIAYASPVLKNSMLLGDWGGTFYLGKNQRISNHISRCEKIMEELAYSFSPGVSFSQIHQLAQLRFRKERLSNATTVSDSDPSRTNVGHTAPFSFDYDFPQGFDSRSDDFRTKVSSARRFLSATEILRVPESGIFTFEARLTDESDEALPNTLVHLMVVVKNGTVELV